MSVYTTLSERELAEFLGTFAVGELAGFQGISEGIENTNYFVDTNEGSRLRRFVLTIFESLDIDELPYFLELTAFLSEHGLPCAHPVANRNGEYLQTLKGKPAALVQRLSGRSVTRPGVEQCALVGEVLGRMHAQARKFTLRRENPRGYDWYHQAAAKASPMLNPQDRQLLRDELVFQDMFRALSLPAGMIHADLFRDNVLFDGDRLGGLIDFYYACDGYFLYDLAITVNDWCSLEDGSLAPASTQALVDGYCAVRPLADGEREYWPALLRAAALRFWLSRLVDWHFPRPGLLTHAHDPGVLRTILLQRIAGNERLQRSWY